MLPFIYSIILFFFFTLLSSTPATATSTAATEEKKIDLLASWTLKAGDEQFYALTEEKISNRRFFFFQFGRGQRTLKIALVDEKKWLQLRSSLANLISNTQGKKNCSSPLSYKQKMKGQALKTTLLCPNLFTASETKTLATWMKTVNDILYTP